MHEAPAPPIFAARGRIPGPGEIWCPVGTKSTVYAVCLLDLERVTPYIPKCFSVISHAGKTTGLVFLSYYGPQSTLAYHELIVMPAMVQYRGKRGMWVSHIYVDCERSVAGGRAVFGLPKELASFDWLGGRPGVARIAQDSAALCTLRYGRPHGRWTRWMGGRSFSVVSDQVLSFSSRIKGDYGVSRVELEIPPESHLAPLGLQPLFGIVCGPMVGYMGERQRYLGRVSGDDAHLR